MSDELESIFEDDFIPTTKYKTGFIEVEKKVEECFVIVDDDKLNIKLYDRHNFAKLKILAKCVEMERDGILINSVRLSKLINKNKKILDALLHNYSVKFPYLKRKFDKEQTDGCFFKYELDKQGLSVYEKLKSRYDQSLDLNLKRKNPEKVKFFNK